MAHCMAATEASSQHRIVQMQEYVCRKYKECHLHEVIYILVKLLEVVNET